MNQNFAQAQTPCLPGLPCPGALATPTDPLHSDQNNAPGPNTPGPNIAGSPNIEKLERSTSPNGNQACNADFMNQIYAKAFLEAEREIVMNASILRKPDSVLEYTCFDQEIAFAADNIGPLFSESTAFDNRAVNINGGMGDYQPIAVNTVDINVNMGADYLDTSLEQLVTNTLSEYLGDNFSHSFLGGAGPTDYTVGANTVCNMINRVHYLSQCENMDQNLSFWTFEDFTQDDPRYHPQQCPGTHGIDDAMIALAENRGFAYAQYDQVQTFLNLSTFSALQTCMPPIPTGVTFLYEERDTDFFTNPIVVRKDQWPDGVCPNPGCSLVEGGNECCLVFDAGGRMHSSIIVKTLFVFSFALALSTSSHAQGLFAPEACDTTAGGYMDSLKSRAELEAQREITMNQNFIAKPDSVLEYTCFDQHLNHLAHTTQNRALFSQSGRWTFGIGTAIGAIGTALGQNTLSPVADSAATFTAQNFAHDYLGGHLQGVNDGNLSSTATASQYGGCDVMNRVWMGAKCIGLINFDDFDGFYTFTHLATNEKRHLPAACTNANIGTRYNDAIDQATNDLTTNWIRDDAPNYFDLIYVANGTCGGASSIINTGIEVKEAIDSTNLLTEHICVVPGCFYDFGSGQCVDPGP